MANLDVKVTIRIPVQDLGQKIRDARKKDGRTVDALAKASGFSRSYWNDIESERVRDGLPIETLRKIEKVLGVDFGVEFNDQPHG